MPDFRYIEAEHAYYLGSNRLPSVTRILRETGNAPDFSAVDPAVLERARQRGIAVHAACQYLDEDDLDVASIAPEIAGYVEAYQRFLRESGARVIDTEQAVWHEAGYAGRYDLRAWIGGCRWLIDRKATATIGEHVGVQAAAYAEANNAMHAVDGSIGTVSEIAALHLRRDGRYTLHRYVYATERARWWGAFAKWKEQNGTTNATNG